MLLFVQHELSCNSDKARTENREPRLRFLFYYDNNVHAVEAGPAHVFFHSQQSLFARSTVKKLLARTVLQTTRNNTAVNVLLKRFHRSWWIRFALLLCWLWTLDTPYSKQSLTRIHSPPRTNPETRAFVPIYTEQYLCGRYANFRSRSLWCHFVSNSPSQTPLLS